MIEDMKCDECNEIMECVSEGTTLLGFHSPLGHDHDDNCKKREYQCLNGHTKIISKRNKCPECGWVGIEKCWCHKGLKVNEWP